MASHFGGVDQSFASDTNPQMKASTGKRFLEPMNNQVIQKQQIKLAGGPPNAALGQTSGSQMFQTPQQRSHLDKKLVSKPGLGS